MLKVFFGGKTLASYSCIFKANKSTKLHMAKPIYFKQISSAQQKFVHREFAAT